MLLLLGRTFGEISTCSYDNNKFVTQIFYLNLKVQSGLQSICKQTCTHWMHIRLYISKCICWYMVNLTPNTINADGYLYSKMPTVRNARSLVTSRELPSGLQISWKSPVECIVLCGYNERWHRQRVWRERQSNSRTRRPWYAIRTFDVSNNGQPP